MSHLYIISEKDLGKKTNTGGELIGKPHLNRAHFFSPS